MKLDEAIEIQTDYVEHLPKGVDEKWIESCKLGIEALKRIKGRRDLNTGWELPLLQGETT